MIYLEDTAGSTGTVSVILNLDVRGGESTPRPDRFHPRQKAPVPTVKKVGWDQAPVWTGIGIQPAPGLEHRIVKPVTSHCAD